MCCRKMNHWLQTSKSKHYFQSLDEVKEFTFKPHAVQESSTNETRHDRHHKQEEISNNRRLLEDIIKLDSAPPDSTMINFPNMLLAARNMPPDSVSETPFELYTSATCMEFHQLLMKLLFSFQDTVKRLLTWNKCIDKTAFMRMARGQAFQMHMESIELQLSDYTPTDTEASMPYREQEDENEDEELNAILDDKLSLSKTYRAWLLMMVVYFDAIEILASFMNGLGRAYETISIKILVPPTTSRKVLMV